jgi:CrcB protein
VSKKYWLVGLGGFSGAIVRYELGGLFKVGSGDFPAGTFLINLTGSFILGLFLTLVAEKYILPVAWRLFFATGFVGAYTTFSSLTSETITLFREGYWPVGLVYSVASLTGGMLFVWLGLLAARQFAFGSFRLTCEEQAEITSREHPIPGLTGSLPVEESNELDVG